MAEAITTLYVLMYIVCGWWAGKKMLDEGAIAMEHDMGGGMLVALAALFGPVVVFGYACQAFFKFAFRKVDETPSPAQYVKVAATFMAAILGIAVLLGVGYVNVHAVVDKRGEATHQRELHEANQRTMNLDELGLIGIRQLKSHPIVGVNGRISGSVFLLNGTLHGTIQTEPLLVVSWKNARGSEYNTTIPYRMFVVETDESLTVPTIEFVMDTTAMNQNKEGRHVLPSELVHKYLRLARVRMSSTVKAQEIYLPQ